MKLWTTQATNKKKKFQVRTRIIYKYVRSNGPLKNIPFPLSNCFTLLFIDLFFTFIDLFLTPPHYIDLLYLHWSFLYFSPLSNFISILCSLSLFPLTVKFALLCVDLLHFSLLVPFIKSLYLTFHWSFLHVSPLLNCLFTPY